MNTHKPVLINPIIRVFKENNKSGKIFDGTFGGGGYSYKFIENGGEVFACDLDKNAIERSSSNPKLHLVQSNFAEHIKTFEDYTFDCIVVDLGFSNNQLQLDNKGFSYQKPDQLLDLRYNEDEGVTVSEFLKKVNYDTLRRVLYENSGEQFANKIAERIIEKRELVKEIKVSDLVEWISESIPKKFYNKKNQVLSRVWQSLRIYINKEFESLNEFLAIAPKKLAVGGVLCIVNFHSLEDKITTKTFREMSQTYDLDNYGNKAQHYELLSRKPITPDQEELDFNPQSRSATLRIIRRCPEQKK